MSEVHGEEHTARAPGRRPALRGLGQRVHRQSAGKPRPVDRRTGPLHLTRPGDALELDLPDPDLADYDRHLDTKNTP